MRVYVIGSSALYFWRRCKNPHQYMKNTVVCPLADCPTSSDELMHIDSLLDRFGKKPIRLMTNNSEKRVMRKQYRYTIRSSHLPEMSFFQVSDNLCVASPEFCLVQSANKHPLPRLAELCMELCGNYSLAPEAQQGFLNREQSLTSISSITCLLQSIPGEIGVNKLEHAMKFVKDGSRSPMETREFLMLCLPKRYGGYGLPYPEINARIALNASEQAIANRRYFECDMLWRDQKVAIEYDGHGNHESYQDRARDAIKRNILLDKGFSTFTVTGGQITDVHSFDKIAHELAKALHHRLYQFPKDWILRRTELRRELFRSLGF